MGFSLLHAAQYRGPRCESIALCGKRGKGAKRAKSPFSRAVLSRRVKMPKMKEWSEVQSLTALCNSIFHAALSARFSNFFDFHYCCRLTKMLPTNFFSPHLGLPSNTASHASSIVIHAQTHSLTRSLIHNRSILINVRLSTFATVHAYHIRLHTGLTAPRLEENPEPSSIL